LAFEATTMDEVSTGSGSDRALNPTGGLSLS
jgi:hypothetical protein